jgi:hypothetical protein
MAYLNLNLKEKIKRKGNRIQKKKKRQKEPAFPGLSAQAAHPRPPS